MLAVPFVYIIIQIGVFSSFIGWLFPFVSMLANLLAERMLGFLLKIIHFFYSSLFIVIKGDRFSAAIWGFFAVIFVAFYLNRKETDYERIETT